MGLVVGSAPEVERDALIEKINLAELRTYTRAISYAEAKTIAMFKRPGSGLVRADQVVTGLLKSKNYKAGESGSLFNLDTGYFETMNGKFRGELEAATGSFRGSLDAATGEFSGNLKAAGGTFSGDVVVDNIMLSKVYSHLGGEEMDTDASWYTKEFTVLSGNEWDIFLTCLPVLKAGASTSDEIPVYIEQDSGFDEPISWSNVIPGWPTTSIAGLQIDTDNNIKLYIMAATYSGSTPPDTIPFLLEFKYHK